MDGVRDLCLVADVTRIKGSIMIALNDVKDGYWVTARKQSLYDMPTEETATTDDEESVALLGGHENKNEINLLAGSCHLFFFFFSRYHLYATT